MQIDKLILQSLATNEEYWRKVLPFLQETYFTAREDVLLFRIIRGFIEKYNRTITPEALTVEIERLTVDRNLHEALKSFVASLRKPHVELQWLLDQTEQFCRDRAIYNAIMKSIGILEGNEKTLTREAIPSLLSEALAVAFHSDVGHDFFTDVEQRYDFYHHIEQKIPFALQTFNEITNGGLPPKTLSIVLAGPGVGKTLFLCNNAAFNLLDGRNVLYITLEMSQERIAERIDANLLDVPLLDLMTLPRDVYLTKLNELRARTRGRLFIREYPTSAANAQHFRNLLHELKIKRNFVPDILYVDYINICASSRYRGVAGVNSYSYVKAIAEELRGIAIEYNIPVVSATQTTRQGYQNTDVEMTDISESFALGATCDFIFALVTDERLDEQKKILVKQIKNRYNDPSLRRKFLIGVDRRRMKLYDIDDNFVPSYTDDEDDANASASFDSPISVLQRRSKGAITWQ